VWLVRLFEHAFGPLWLWYFFWLAR
jgi:hypothetical protein